MNAEQANVATIIETTPCPLCGAAEKQPCTGRNRVWIASVHHGRRLVAAKFRNYNRAQWGRLLKQAKEIDFKEHAEYLRKQVAPE